MIIQQVSVNERLSAIFTESAGLLRPRLVAGTKYYVKNRLYFCSAGLRVVHIIAVMNLFLIALSIFVNWLNLPVVICQALNILIIWISVLVYLGSKVLIGILRAASQASAQNWVQRQLARTPQTLTETDILHLHCLLSGNIDIANAGRYRQEKIRITDSATVFPSPSNVPDLMAEFAEWLESSQNLQPVELAIEAHYRLVTIHPFADGNGRAARLLMNMILLMAGLPAANILKGDRLAYCLSLEKAQIGGSKDEYLRIMTQAIARSARTRSRGSQGGGSSSWTSINYFTSNILDGMPMAINESRSIC